MPGHYDVIIRDVSKFISVVDEQTPGNDDDTMIINTGELADVADDHVIVAGRALGD